ncbi:hypothetical protein FYJ80_09515 [Spirochaetales bacterium NM-380-WT-3C1]|uniref:prephenate dehydratase n=1 Tax=Bullifex porci TaxID=2606638 RepID=A0A7X2PDY4_9SPIO|nr:prephenate dehydratase domain-containing protein [Bullifex porci]MSU07007.1 hypothetical protein [Bullifex porci]
MKKLLVIILFGLSLVSCATSQNNYEWTRLTGETVSYLGPEGTYTGQAAKLFFGDDVAYYAEKTVSDAVASMISGKYDFAVIPQENTVGGPVTAYIDELLSHDDISVVCETELVIDQALLMKKEAELVDITLVCSHEQGLIQGKKWLEENLPFAHTQIVSSTAEGARLASISDKSVAAVASAAAADVYDLKVYAPRIQESDANRTRFYALSTGEKRRERADRMLFSAKGNISDFPKLIKAFGALKPAAITARPLKTNLGEYIWLIELKDSGYDEFLKISNVDGFEFKYYGSFPLI